MKNLNNQRSDELRESAVTPAAEPADGQDMPAAPDARAETGTPDEKQAGAKEEANLLYPSDKSSADPQQNETSSEESDPFDSLFETAAQQLEEELDEAFLKDMPKEPVVFSAEHEKAMKKLFRDLRRETPAYKRTYRFATRAACIVAVIAVVSMSGAVLGIESWRNSVIRIFINRNSINTDYHFEVYNPEKNVPEQMTLGYIPDGFTLTEEYSISEGKILMYENQNDFFNVLIKSAAYKFNVDTENGTTQDILINGKDAKYISNDELKTVIWFDDSYAYQVSGNLLKKEIIKIAENVNN